MFESLLASHNQSLRRARIDGATGVYNWVRAVRIETITSTDGSIVFWFAPDPMSERVNRPATEMLLAATRFTARSVPLLRDNVVISGRDAAGGLASLTASQVDWLINSKPRTWQDWVLARRCAAQRRAVRRRWRAEEAAREEAWWNDA